MGDDNGTGIEDREISVKNPHLTLQRTRGQEWDALAPPDLPDSLNKNSTIIAGFLQR
jgi:hypothetical protein